MLGFRRIFKTKKQLLSKTSKLLPADVMERLLAKERERCDRYCHYFSLVVIQCASVQFEQLCLELDVYFADRLRLSDDFGLLKKSGVGILLPMTDLGGAQVVLKDVHQFARERKIEIETEVFSYSGHGGSEPAIVKHRRTDDASSFRPPHRGSRDSFNNDALSSAVALATAPSSTFAEPQDGFRPGDSIVATVRSHREPALLAHCAPAFPVWKRAFDICGALAGLVLTAPVIIIAGIAIKLTSKGPIFFKQMRCGQYGRPFPIYKLRTMVIDAEDQKALLQERNERDGPAFKVKNDPRVTTVGSFLRRVGIDELPQLLNVLFGHMSIVGPRPLPVAEDIQCASWQRKRLDTKPGLTCTWQVGKSRKITFRDWMRLDLRYAKARSPWSDARLIMKTVAAVFLGRVGH